jgi:uncharacterized protein (DUF2249 family)
LTGIKASSALRSYAAGMMSHQTVRLDVRAVIRAGAEPCSEIMQQAKRLPVGDTLQLIAPFEPTPLYEMLGREGFTHEARALEGGDWEVRFTRAPQEVPAGPDATSVTKAPRASHCDGEAGEVMDMDVRGLEPPQPMVRILDAVAALPEGASLRARTDWQPVLLFEQLEARGFHGEGSEDSEGGYVTLIRRR